MAIVAVVAGPKAVALRAEVQRLLAEVKQLEFQATLAGAEAAKLREVAEAAQEAVQLAETIAGEAAAAAATRTIEAHSAAATAARAGRPAETAAAARRRCASHTAALAAATAMAATAAMECVDIDPTVRHKTLPLPCASTAFVAKTVPFPCVPQIDCEPVSPTNQARPPQASGGRVVEAIEHAKVVAYQLADTEEASDVADAAAEVAAPRKACADAAHKAAAAAAAAAAEELLAANQALAQARRPAVAAAAAEARAAGAELRAARKRRCYWTAQLASAASDEAAAVRRSAATTRERLAAPEAQLRLAEAAAAESHWLSIQDDAGVYYYNSQTRRRSRAEPVRSPRPAVLVHQSSVCSSRLRRTHGRSRVFSGGAPGTGSVRGHAGDRPGWCDRAAGRAAGTGERGRRGLRERRSEGCGAAWWRARRAGSSFGGNPGRRQPAGLLRSALGRASPAGLPPAPAPRAGDGRQGAGLQEDAGRPGPAGPGGASGPAVGDRRGRRGPGLSRAVSPPRNPNRQGGEEVAGRWRGGGGGGGGQHARQQGGRQAGGRRAGWRAG